VTLSTGSLPTAAAFNEQLIRRAFWIGCVAICSSAFAFGAVYPWAYWPVASICAISGALALIALRRSVNVGISRSLAIALALVLSAAALQLVPLPMRALNAISPHASYILRELYPDEALGLSRAHSLSISPSATWMALALYGSLVVFLAGFSCVLSVIHPRRFVEALTVAGVLMALCGIIQNSLGSERIYGFWTPEMAGAQSFGPFVNKNHFAGWILLVLPVTLGLFLAGLDKALAYRRGWRDRLLWFSSTEANRLALLGAAVLVMGLSLVLTMSRSGITALAVAVLMCAGYVAIRARTHARSGVATIYLAVLVVTLAGYVGTDAIAAHFSKINWSEFNNRRGVWIDTLNIARDFPVAGAGLNAFQSADLIYQRHNLEQHFSASHNDYLQLLAEGGVLLTVPIVFALLIAARDIARRFHGTRGTTAWWLRAGAVTALLAISLQELVDFSLQIPANAVLFAAVCALAFHRAPERRDTAPGAAKRVTVFSTGHSSIR